MELDHIEKLVTAEQAREEAQVLKEKEEAQAPKEKE
jgi:hypothetical protein